jgi:(1->4)-alpha-D-glucan 1-alpha-D-glucosylmutase
MLATATQDHKRGEDVRARLNVLSERPREWSRRVQRWARLNRMRRGTLDDRPVPGRNDEYLFYQTVVGAWPMDLAPPDFAGIADFADRIAAYMLKAAREAKLRTSWTAPNAEYEAMLDRFVREALDPVRGRYFLANLTEFQDEIAAAGALNGLAQTLLKLVAPGVPDIYQGTELWDLSLVDPDNRRPVDYARRAAPPEEAAAVLVGSWRDGRIKQHVIRRALALRRQRPALFAAGDYQPIEATGAEAGRLLALARGGAEGRVVAVVPRLVATWLRGAATPLVPAQLWGDTRLPLGGPDGAWRNVLTGEAVTAEPDGSVPIARLLAEFPIALLASGDEVR